jgi:hypothetical protein
MFGEPNWMKFSLQGGKEGSELKGAHRHIILSSIARNRGMKWSANNGLMSGDGKELVSKDGNEIAKKLLGQTATIKDLADPEAIIDFIIKLPNYEELVKDARETLGREGIKLPVAGKVESFVPGSGAWFRKMIEVVK